MTPDEWMREYEKQRRLRDAHALLRKNGVKLSIMTQPKEPTALSRKDLWRKQLVPGTVPARSAEELIERMGFAVARKS